MGNFPKVVDKLECHMNEVRYNFTLTMTLEIQNQVQICICAISQFAEALYSYLQFRIILIISGSHQAEQCTGLIINYHVMVLFIQRQNRIGCFQTSISQLSLLPRILCCNVYSLESSTLVVVIRRSCQLACP